MIAYFCSEYALDPRLKSYAGGLGILAGDTVREMGDQGMPFIGIGLYYYKGYLARDYDWATPESAGLSLVRDRDGGPLYISLPIGKRSVTLRIWEYSYKTAKVLLLDAMVHMNHPDDQRISYFLYDQDIRLRLAQEMVLGIGGMRVLKILQINPNVYHMNEGHSSFLHLEAPENAKVVFTNHTVVVEGNHMYQNSLMREMFELYFKENAKYSLEQFIELGKCSLEDVFSLTALATRVSKIMNGVSKLHTQKLKEIYKEIDIKSITNGIHVKTWLRNHHAMGLDGALDESTLQMVHTDNKKGLLLYIEHATGVKWDENTLILGWGRRFIQYKRPLAIFGDLLRLWQILNNKTIKVGIVIAGIPHPKDEWANKALDILLSSLLEKFENKIVYLPNYSQQLAKIMIPGCDVWVNTPIVGLEACGTSGMKAGLNGVMQMSTKDGWLAEIDMKPIGWELQNEDVSKSFYDILEGQIMPKYQEYIEKGGSVDTEWANMMYANHMLVQEQFSTERMVEEYKRVMWG
ncbi:MAG: alpha-glucan family phosphorylase [Patescibacteria group bacterium]